MQSLSDRTVQSASSVRSQRATVIQTVSQGERVGATAESVANYNHCHAITIQYFEVLRHFSVHTRLADVQECLFVPLHITSFDLEKCLRWRTTLEKYLFRPDLLRGFDAILRILKEKENAEDYYGSIGFPRSYFAEQPMKAFSGALFIEFTFFNTQEGKVSDDLVRLLRVFGFSIDPAQYNDRYISNSELAEMVGPRAIEFLLDSIVIETDKGSDLRVDLTLLNRFRQNAILQVSMRQSANTPNSYPSRSRQRHQDPVGQVEAQCRESGRSGAVRQQVHEDHDPERKSSVSVRQHVAIAVLGKHKQRPLR